MTILIHPPDKTQPLFLPLCIDIPPSAIENTALDSVWSDTGFHLIDKIRIGRTPEVQLMYHISKLHSLVERHDRTINLLTWNIPITDS